jgi:uncharacterized protein YkwD
VLAHFIFVFGIFPLTSSSSIMKSVMFAGVVGLVEADSYNCPGSSAAIHAWMEVTVTANAACDAVQAEIEARAGGGNWVDPHNGGIYSVLSSSNGLINTQRMTNQATSVGGTVYTDKQTFELTSVDGGCQIKGCSESQSTSVGDFSTNYCDLRNLYCGSADGCSTATSDFTSTENSHKGSLGAGHDSSQCIVKSSVPLAEAASYNCPGSSAALHASMKVTVEADAGCDVVQAEIEARAGGGSWVDPHNGGIYSVLSSSNGLINTQRTTNPATSVGGTVYTDKQTFELTSTDGGCQIKGCSESQSSSVGDFSTNYCDMRNLYCGSADGCTQASNDFTSTEKSHSGSLGAGHDSSQCIVSSSVSV